MRVLTTCTVRALRKNPVRTAVTVVGIALACALIFAVATSAQSLYSYVVQTEVARNGAYNAMALGATARQAADAATADGVTQTASLQRQGFALVNEATTINPYVCIEALEPGEGPASAFARLVSLVLTEGRMPQTPDEVLLPASLRASGLVEAEVGETVSFEVGHRVSNAAGAPMDASDLCYPDADGFLDERLEDVRTRTFTVVGFYDENYALSRGANIDSGVMAAGVPAITVAECGPAQAAAAGEEGDWQVYFAVNDPANAGTIARQAAGDDAQIVVNRYINRITSFSLDIGAYQTLMALVAVVTAVVVVASVMFVRNSFAISVSERTRQFGLLSSIGATRRQLRGMVMREAVILACVGIPLGLVVGYLGTAAVLAVCSDLIVSWASGTLGSVPGGVAVRVVATVEDALVSALLAFLTVVASAWGPAWRASRMSAMDAIRSARDVKMPRGVRRSGRLAGRLLGIEGSIAAKSYRRAAKPRRATVAALVTGSVLVTTSLLLGTYIDAFFYAAAPDATRQTYDLTYFFYDSSISGEEGKKATSEQACQRIAAADGVDGAVYMLHGGVRAYLDPASGALSAWGADELGTDGGDGPVYVDVAFVEDAPFEAFLEQAGIDMGQLAGRAVAVNVLQANSGRYEVGRPFSGAPFSFEAVTEVGVDSPLNDAGGVAVTGGSAWIDEAGFEHVINDYEAGEHSLGSIEVGAITDQIPWWMGTPSTPRVVLPLSAAAQVDPALADAAQRPDLRNFAWNVLVYGDDPAAAEAGIRAVLGALGLSDTRLYNMTASTQSMVALFQTARVFTLAFAAIVALIAVTGAFNTMYTCVGLRRREFAVLRSVGMTRRGLAKMMVCECGVYAVRVFLWAAPLCCLISYGLYRAIGVSVSGSGYIVPWELVGVSLAAFAVVGVACAYALRKVDEGASPVSALRSETV